MFAIFSHQQIAWEESSPGHVPCIARVCTESTFSLPCYSFTHELIIFILMGLRQEAVVFGSLDWS